MHGDGAAPGKTVSRMNHWSDNVESLAILGMGIVLLIWLFGFTALLFRKPRPGRTN
jgi:hypothetical protein